MKFTKNMSLAAWHCLREHAWTGKTEMKMHGHLMKLFKPDDAGGGNLLFHELDLGLDEREIEFITEALDTRLTGKNAKPTPGELSAAYTELVDAVDFENSLKDQKPVAAGEGA